MSENDGWMRTSLLCHLLLPTDDRLPRYRWVSWAWSGGSLRFLLMVHCSLVTRVVWPAGMAGSSTLPKRTGNISHYNYVYLFVFTAMKEGIIIRDESNLPLFCASSAHDHNPSIRRSYAFSSAFTHPASPHNLYVSPPLSYHLNNPPCRHEKSKR